MIKNLVSFDGTENISSQVLRPDRYRDLFKNIQQNDQVIARGSGLSYGLASAGSEVTSISTELFDRVLSFDSMCGKITVESGITLGSLLDFAVSQGWQLPVVPGYPQITIGGCLAFNVHGKSQYHGGCFGNFVTKFTLFHPAYGEIECSRQTNNEIFELTIGGFGFTGFVISVELQLVRLKSRTIQIKKIPVNNFIEAYELMKRSTEGYDQIYSWHDANLRNTIFGKGIVYLETSSPNQIHEQTQSHYNSFNLNSRKTFPLNLWNSFFTPQVMKAYQYKERLLPSDIIVDIKNAAFPINGKEIFYKMFGKHGFREYQLIINSKYWEAFIVKLEKLIVDHRISVALASLKLFKGQKQFLNFVDDGVCLALDIANTKNCIYFLKDLDQVLLEYHGILNLSKDSRASSDLIRNMFPGYDDFKNKLNSFDSKKRFSSNLRKRINV